MKTPHWRPSPRLLLCLFLGVTASTVCMGGIGLYKIRARLVHESGLHLSAAAANAAHHLDRFMAERMEEIRSLAEEPTAGGEGLGLNLAVAASPSLQRNYRWIGVTDATGRVITATSPMVIGEVVTVSPEGMDLLLRTDPDGAPVLDVTVPFRDQVRHGSGALVGRLNPGALNELFRDAAAAPHPGPSSPADLEWQMVTEGGRVILSVPPLDAKVPPIHSSLAVFDQPLSDAGYLQAVHRLRRAPIMIGFATVRVGTAAPAMRVLVCQDLATIAAPMRRLLWTITVGWLLVVGPVLGLLWWTLWRLSREWQEARLRDRAIAATSKGLVITDARQSHRPIIYANPAFLSLTGYSSEEVLGKPYTILVGPETDPAAIDTLTKALHDGRPCRTLLRQSRKDRPSFWSEVTLSPVRDDSGRLTEFMWVVADVTDRQEAVDLLKQSEERFRLVVEASPSGILMIDSAGRIMLVNRQIERQFGYTRDELVGQSVECLIPERFRIQHQGHRARFFAAPTARAMGTRRDLYGLRKNGTEFPIEIGLQPITTTTGRHVLASIVDMTEHRHKEQELQESEERFRTMADTAPVLIWMSGPDKLFTYFNKGWLEFRGRTMEQELGNGWAEGVHPDDFERCLQTYHEAFDSRRPFIMEYRLKRSDAVYRWMLDTGTPRITPSGDFAGYIGSCVDISDRKTAEEDRARLEAQIRHTQKMEAIGTLAGGIAHEFNNSLTAILGFSELALKKIPPDARAHAQIQQVIKAGRRSRDLVHQILTFSRQTEQERRPLSLDGLVKEAVKLLRPTLPPTIELHECIASPTHPVLADPIQLHQLVLNLWTNAVHAMHAGGGRLDIRLENVEFDADTLRGGQPIERGSYVRFLIQDTGTGIDPEVKARMFDPFFTTKDVNEHTGMGLAVVYGIVTAHGGRLCVESWPGNGTRVEVYLPTVPLTDVAEPSSDAPLPRGHECVLFVEDEPPLAELGREMLESLDYYTVVRTSAADALAAFSTAPQRFDLVITDYIMPDMTGDRLAQELLRLRPDIPILLCTGTPLPRQNLLRSGIRATLHKPLFAHDVAIALRRVLDHPVTNGTARASIPSISEELHAVGPDR